MDLQMQHAAQQPGHLEQDRSSTTSLTCYGRTAPDRGLHGHAQHMPSGSSPPAAGSWAEHSSSSTSITNAVHDSRKAPQVLQQQPSRSVATSSTPPHIAPLGTCQQQQQQQHRPFSSVGSPLHQPPAELLLVANLTKALLHLAAEHAFPAAAARLKEQLLQHVRLAAAAAAEAGQPFDVATAVEQLLPDLQQAVLRACKEAQQQREAVAPPAAAAAALQASQHQQHQSISAAASASALSSAKATLSTGDVQGAQQCNSTE